MNTTASARDGVEPIKVASACLGHVMSSILWILVPSLFSNMALGYQTDLEASFWATYAYYVGLASIDHPQAHSPGLLASDTVLSRDHWQPQEDGPAVRKPRAHPLNPREKSWKHPNQVQEDGGGA